MLSLEIQDEISAPVNLFGIEICLSVLKHSIIKTKKQHLKYSSESEAKAKRLSRSRSALANLDDHATDS